MNSDNHDGIPHHDSRNDVQHHFTSSSHLPDQQGDSRFGFLPDTLRGRIPELWLLMLEKNNRIVIETALLLIAFFTLFATIIGSPHRAEWVSVVTALLAPMGFTVWYVLFPLNPYHTLFFNRQGLKNLDQSDSTAAELVLTLSSAEAGRFIWQCAQRLWLIFFLPMILVVLIERGLPGWESSPSWLIRIPIFCILLFAVFRIEMLAWALRTLKLSEQK